MNTYHHRNIISRIRILPGLLLVLALLGRAAGPAAPTVAAAETPARLQVVVKEVTIHDDRDGTFSGNGEMHLYLHVLECHDGVSFPCGRGDESDSVFISEVSYDASTGQTVTLERLIPQSGDSIYDPATSAAFGFPVLPKRQYHLRFTQKEYDAVLHDDRMGEVHQGLNAADLGLGLHTARSVRDDGSSPGDYTITYEIRRTPLPDLEPTGYRLAVDAPGDRDDIHCFTIINRGTAASPPFQVLFAIDGVAEPHSDINASDLAAGESREQCTSRRLPDLSGQFLWVVVNPYGHFLELDDNNNVYRVQPVHVRVGDGGGPVVISGNASDQSDAGAPPNPGPVLSSPAGAEGVPDASGTGDAVGAGDAMGPRTSSTPSSAPSPKPSAALPDLTIGAVKVNGRVPDGKDDCKDGKNSVTVVVKNAGTAEAGRFELLVADDDLDAGQTKTVPGLGAGQEREIRFDNVRLGKGKHTLGALVDVKHAVTESKEDNNTLKVTASCKDDD